MSCDMSWSRTGGNRWPTFLFNNTFCYRFWLSVSNCLELRQALGTQAFTYPVVLVDRWGVTDDLATSSLHSSHLSAFLMAAPSVMPVHSGMLSSHLFFCLPLLHPPCTVPCRIVLASPEDLVMCPYHFSLHRFTVVKRSSWGPMAKKTQALSAGDFTMADHISASTPGKSPCETLNKNRAKNIDCQ